MTCTHETSVKMIIHADMMLNGLLRVVKNDNRFEFTNPGLLKLPVERIYAGGKSKARNQRMQALLRMIGFGEGLGSGFPLILNAWEEKRWVRPELIEEQDLMQVKLVLYIEQEKQHVGVNTIEDIYQKLTGRQRAILGLLSNDSSLTAERMAQALSVTQRTIERNLSVLQESGILTREGSDKTGHWVIKTINAGN